MVIVGVVVQWLDYLAACHARARRSVPHSRESGISCGATLVDWHKLHLTSGTADMAMWSDRNSHTVVAHDQSCVEG